MIAHARLDMSSPPYRWVVEICPHCGGRHTHGAGTNPARVREFLGNKVAHCARDRHTAAGRSISTYELIEDLVESHADAA